MSDRIDLMTQGLPGKIAERAGGTAASRKSGGPEVPALDTRGAPMAEGDRVELTSSARLLERLEKTFDSFPELDRARVDAVKDAIKNGDYRVDADRIAAALIVSDRQLGR